MTERLYRSPDDRMLAGVAGGVAESLDADPSLVRVVWAVLVFLTGGLALLVYIVMAIVVPERPAWTAAAAGTTAPDGTTTGDNPPAGPAEGQWLAPDGSTVPLAASSPAPRARRRNGDDRSRGGLVVGLVLILLGAFFLVRQLIPSLDLGLWWPVVAIGLGILLIVLALVPPRRPS